MNVKVKNEVPAGIVWLASYPKSGNTWVRNFLNNLLAVQQHGLSVEASSINSMNKLTSWDIASRPFEEVLGKKIAEATPKEIAAARLIVQKNISNESDGIMLVKTHNALVLDHGYPTINMSVTSGVIYIVRNPLDVAISFGHHIGKDTDTAIISMCRSGHTTKVFKNAAHEIYGSWSEHVSSWTRKPNPSLYIMRYEDMHSAPEKTFGALAKHMKMNPSNEQLQKAIELSSFENLKQQEEKEGFKEKPKAAESFFRKGEADQWKKELTQAQIGKITQVHGTQMRRFGYIE